MEVIRSKNNSLIKQTKKLWQKKYRTNSYLIEGWHLYQEALQAGVPIEAVFVVEEEFDRLKDQESVVLVTKEVLAELSETKTPQGVITQVALPETDFQEMKPGKYLILEDVQDPGNVGTMIRTADAAGFDAVFISSLSADIYSSKVLRSMQGSHFHLPVFRTEMVELVAHFKKQGIPLLATTLSENSIDYKSLDIDSSFALVMGNEGRGISPFMETSADHLVHITMPGQAESLNVAIAAGILMFSLI